MQTSYKFIRIDFHLNLYNIYISKMPQSIIGNQITQKYYSIKGQQPSINKIELNPQSTILKDDPNQPCRYKLYLNEFKEKCNKLIKEYETEMTIVKSNKNLKISTYQIKQFAQGKISKQEFIYSYDILTTIIQNMQNVLRLNQSEIPLHESLMKFYGNHFEKYNYSIYLFGEKMIGDTLDMKIDSISEFQLVFVVQRLAQIFSYLNKYMEGKLKYFDIENCVRIDLEKLQVKLGDYGINQDSRGRLSTFLTKQDSNFRFFKFPFSEAGKFIPCREFYELDGFSLEQKINQFKFPVENKDKIGSKFIYNSPPSLTPQDQLWSLGMIILRYFYEQYPVKTSLFQTHTLQLQQQLRNIATYGLKGIHQNIKPKKPINELWEFILNWLLTGKQPQIQNSCNQNMKDLYSQIFENQSSYNKDPLQYFENVFWQMRYTYIPTKYTQKIQKLQIKVFQAQPQIQQPILTLSKLSQNAYSIMMYLMQLPLVINMYQTAVDWQFEKKQTKTEESFMQDNLSFCLRYKQMYLILREMNPILREISSKLLKLQNQQQYGHRKQEIHMIISKNQKIIDLNEKWITICVQTMNKLRDKCNDNANRSQNAKIIQIYKRINFETREVSLSNFQELNRRMFQTPLNKQLELDDSKISAMTLISCLSKIVLKKSDGLFIQNNINENQQLYKIISLYNQFDGNLVMLAKSSEKKIEENLERLKDYSELIKVIRSTEENYEEFMEDLEIPIRKQVYDKQIYII